MPLGADDVDPRVQDLVSIGLRDGHAVRLDISQYLIERQHIFCELRFFAAAIWRAHGHRAQYSVRQLIGKMQCIDAAERMGYKENVVDALKLPEHFLVIVMKTVFAVVLEENRVV